MSEPRRLLDDPETPPLARSFLQTWADVRPTPAARQRTLIALGIGAGVASSAVAAGGASTSAASSITLIKWLVGTLAIGAAAAGIAAGDRPKIIADANDVEPRVEAQASVHGAPIPLATVAVAESSKRDSGVSIVAGPPPTLAEEIAAIDRARASLPADPKAALAGAEAYEHRFPSGAFLEEAEVLRVEALVASRNERDAIRVATRFLATHPTSVHVARVRALTVTK